MTGADHVQLPPKPLCPDVEVNESDCELELVHARSSWPLGCVLLLFVGFFVLVIVVASKDVPADVPIHPAQILGGIALAAMLVGAILYALAAFFGVERIRIGTAGLCYEQRVFVTVCRCWFPLDEVKGVHAARTISSERHESNSGRFVTFDTLGEPILFARGMSEREQRWLIAKINSYLDTLRPVRPIAEDLISTDRNDAWVLRPSPVRRPPADSVMQFRRDVDTVEFASSGRYGVYDLVATSLLCLFCNGILAIPVWGLSEHFNWLVFFFLFPFAGLGVVLLVAWFYALTAPAWRLTWTFREHEVVKRVGGFGVGWSKRYAVPPLERIELRWQHGSGSYFRPRAHFALSFIGTDRQEALRVPGLTEGEARWMASVVFEMFPAWFSSPRSSKLQTELATQAVRPAHCDVDVEEVAGNFVLSYGKANWGLACFLLLFLICWSAVCGLLLVNGMALFAVPAVAGWMFLFAVALRSLLTIERIRLGPNGLEHETGTVRRRRRRVPLAELKDVRAGTMPSLAVSETGEEYYGPERSPEELRADLGLDRDHCIRFETLGDPVLFGRGVARDERHWLVVKLAQYLAQLQGERQSAGGQGPQTGPSILGPAPVPMEPPSDSSARLLLGPRYAEFLLAQPMDRFRTWRRERHCRCVNWAQAQ